MKLITIAALRRESFTIMTFTFDGFSLTEKVNCYYTKEEIEERGILTTTVLGLN
jgi:hypothetical protein